MAFETSGRTATVSRIFSTYALTPGATTDIVTVANGSPVAGLQIPRMAGVLRITICLTTGSTLILTTTDGATAYTDSLFNSGTALTAKAVYLFEMPISATKEGYDDNTAGTALLHNLQLGSNVVIRFLWVDYVSGPLV